jgi:hypothetical protein
VAAAAAAGHPVNGTAGFAAIITINTPNADIFGYANIVNANGEKRVPLLRVNNAVTSTSTITVPAVVAGAAPAGGGTVTVTVPGTIAE